ncbi:MAG TPA: hypothetical protein DIC52_08815 [Candidatus Latescibacteria bacterium]|nr:hypothetical protein [Candidatus Latescibacterota bacterium]
MTRQAEERTRDESASCGTEYNWANVLAWDPPERSVVAWHPSLTPEAASIIEVRFSSVDEGTALWLEHRGWEEFGPQQGEATRTDYDTGWDLVMTAFLDSQNR